MPEPSALLRDSVCFVTGGAGFIGSHLLTTLTERGARRLVALDNLRTGAWTNVREAGVEHVTADFSTLTVDDLVAHLRGSDFLFHLAAEKHNQALDIPERVLSVNVDGTHRLLEAARRAGVKKVIFSSSLYAAGRRSLPPMREDDLPVPATVYGISKLAGEHLLRYFREVQGLRSTAFRLFFVYGPRQYAGSGYKSVIVNNFERILRGEAPVIRGDGRQALDYVFVGDVVDAMVSAVDERGDGETINIGSGRAVTINELTDAMIAVSGSRLTPQHAAADLTAGTVRVCDNRKAESILGWRPRTSLVDGLAEVYRWMAGAR